MRLREELDLTAAERTARREAFDEYRREEHKARLARRATIPLWMRLETTLNALSRLGAVKAGAIGRVPRGESEVVLPAGGDRTVAHLRPFETVFHLRIIEKHLERLEEAVDVHRGLAPARNFAGMMTHEKNAFILTECVGMRPEDIAGLTPNGELGTARAVRDVRERWAAEPKNWPSGPVRGVCGHRPGECLPSCPRLPRQRAQPAGNTENPAGV